MNTTKTIEILAAEPRIIKYAGQDILVREVEWPDLFRFLELLASKASGMIKLGADGKPALDLIKVTPEGRAELDLSGLPALIRSSEELVQLLLNISTDIPAGMKIPGRVMFKLIEVALEVNITEEFLAAGKSMAARVAAALPGQAKTQSEPSSKSSGLKVTQSASSATTPTDNSSGGPSDSRSV